MASPNLKHKKTTRTGQVTSGGVVGWFRFLKYSVPECNDSATNIISVLLMDQTDY